MFKLIMIFFWFKGWRRTSERFNRVRRGWHKKVGEKELGRLSRVASWLAEKGPRILSHAASPSVYSRSSWSRWHRQVPDLEFYLKHFFYTASRTSKSICWLLENQGRVSLPMSFGGRGSLLNERRYGQSCCPRIHWYSANACFWGDFQLYSDLF